RLALRDWHGIESEIEDPYRFGTIITGFDLHLHSEGKLNEAWNTLGAHCMTIDDVAGVHFAVWAPNAEVVSVAGDFNSWDTRRHPMPVCGRFFCRGRRQGMRTSIWCGRGIRDISS